FLLVGAVPGVWPAAPTPQPPDDTRIDPATGPAPECTARPLRHTPPRPLPAAVGVPDAAPQRARPYVRTG
ncbi:hypothetical protein ACFV7R_42270, partial [Streptomyces sp. NPDC059866]